MPITNTLENAKRLEALGAPSPLARGIAEILEEAIQANNQDLKAFFREELERQIGGLRAELKADISSLRTELKADISSLRAELKADIASVRTELAQTRAELKADISSLRAEMRTDNANLRADLQREMRKQLLWFFTMAAGIATIAVAVIKLFPNAG